MGFRNLIEFMKIKALKNFCGTISMSVGEERDCSDEAVVSDLIRAGYVEAVENPVLKEEKKSIPAKQTRAKKAVSKSESK